jgi:hypothetical protein
MAKNKIKRRAGQEVKKIKRESFFFLSKITKKKVTISPPWLLAAEEMPAKITAPFLSPFRFWVTRTNERTKTSQLLHRGVVRLFVFSEDK